MSVLKVDTPYGREVDALFTPDVIEGLQRAASILRSALPAVKEAMDILSPVQEAQQAIIMSRYNDDGLDEGDLVYDAVRERTAWGPAVDLTFEILDEVKRVAY